MALHRLCLLVLSLPCWLLMTGCSSEPTATQPAATKPAATEPVANGANQAGSQPSASQPSNDADGESDVDRSNSSTPQISAEAFRMAAHDGRLTTVQAAIESGINVDAKDPGRNYTALHMAAYNGHTETVKYLIAQGASIDPRDHEGKTPLIHACTGPFAPTVKALIEAGADVNAKDTTESFTPLMMAAGLGQKEVVAVLLQHGADKTALDDDNESALDHARNAGHAEIVKQLEQ